MRSRWTTGNEEDDEKYAEQLEAGEITFEFELEDGTKHGYLIDPETGGQVNVYLKEEADEPPDDSED